MQGAPRCRDSERSRRADYFVVLESEEFSSERILRRGIVVSSDRVPDVSGTATRGYTEVAS